MIKVCNRIIEYSFYCLFLLVPLAFTSATSELFELNKMWLTWALTIVIVAAWIIKMILQKRILFQRTPLDIPIGLFLISQIISTIFSQDVHVSLWGYYSRFNGGLLSIISYILLYYAFVSNFVTRERHESESEKHENSFRDVREKISDFREISPIGMVKRLLMISLISGLIVSLWGLPSHFGYDPTCFLFRGTLDVSCWTADFIPTIRIFSTLGQPDWLAAYLAILLPITLAFYLNSFQSQKTPHEKLQIANSKLQKYNSNFKFPMYIFYLLFAILFYLDLLYTRARSGVLGVWFSLIFFAAAYFWFYGKPKLSFSTEKLKSPFSILFFGFLITTFVIGTPINQLHRFTLEGIRSVFQKPATTETQKETKSSESGGLARRSPPKADEGGTESGDIRLNVWKGAINAWKANPIIGSGVETFAFAYYKYKPAEHNLTSEWNFLYNKAHNEYLNYLATTGLAGLGTYLLMIGAFLWIVLTKITNSFAKFAKRFAIIREQNEPISEQNFLLILAVLSGYIATLVINFFGFSVVITNIYLFMIPAFVFILNGTIKTVPVPSPQKSAQINLSIYQWSAISFAILASLFMILNLFRFWRADIAYALGYNLDRAGEYQQAYPNLHKAVGLRGDEPVFKDELSINNAIIAAALLSQQSSDGQKEQTASVAASLTKEAINASNEIISKSPNNAVFWKTRVRLFYTLSQIDSGYLPRALEGIEKASLLAPADANIWYNLGVLYGQNNNIAKGIEALEKTIKLKPDYRDAHYALGLYYHTASLDEKAIAQMQYILDYLSPQDPDAQDFIKSWGK